jgi:hypothetical protein
MKVTFDEHIIFSGHFNIANSQNISVDLVGQKALGLLKCQQDHTPRFFIITSVLFNKWKEEKEEAEKILQKRLSEILEKIEGIANANYIVRSSAKFETFEERGFYKSSAGGVAFGSLLQTIKEIWNNNIANVNKYLDNEFAIIVQQYIKPRLIGHLSNERRISRNKTEWLLEIANEKNEFLENIKFSSKPLQTKNNSLNFSASTKPQLIKSLKAFTPLAVKEKERIHIEWVWDGKTVWIVQKDL